MALYKEDIVAIELESGSIHRSFLNHSIGLGDLKANRFGVRIFRNGEAVNIGSGTCQGFFMSPNGTNLQIQGSTYTGVDGNMAWVQLPQDAYAYEGQFCLAIKLIGGGVTGTMRIIDGMVANTGTTGAVSPTSTVPTSQEIIAAYNNAVNVIDSSVRFDITQSLTDTQKAKARTNIDAASVGTANELAMDIGALAEGSANNSYIDLGNKWMPFRRGYYSTPAVGSASSYQSNSQYFYALVMCQPGDILHAHCYGNSTVYAWAFLDSNLNVLSRGGTGNFEGTQTAPASTSYVLVNVDISHMSTGFYAWVGEERTGEKISDLKSALSYVPDSIEAITGNNFGIWKSGYYTTPAVGSAVSLTASSNWITTLIPVTAGDKIYIDSYGGTSVSRQYVYIDSEWKATGSRAESGTTGAKMLTAPANAVYVAVNNRLENKPSGFYAVKSLPIKTAMENGFASVNEDFTTTNTKIDNTASDIRREIASITGNTIYQFNIDKWISTSSTVDITALESHTGAACAVVACEEGDEFTVTGHGFTSSHMLWTFIDSNGVKKRSSGSNVVADKANITAPVDAAYLVVNVNTSYLYELYSQKLLDQIVRGSTPGIGDFKQYKDENGKLPAGTYYFSAIPDDGNLLPLIVNVQAKYDSGETTDVPYIQIECYSKGGQRIFYSHRYSFASDTQFVKQAWRIPNCFETGKLRFIITVPEGTTLEVKYFECHYDMTVRYGTGNVVFHAHRGFDKLLPPGAYNAYVAAAELGFQSCIEIPKFTSDGVAVCFHNDGGSSSKLSDVFTMPDGSAVSALTDSSKISDFTYAELMQWSIGYVKNPIFADAKISTMDDFLRICAETGMRPIFSIHPNPTMEQWAQLKALLDKYKLTKWLSVKSGDTAVWKNVIDTFGDGNIFSIINIVGTTSTYNILTKITNGRASSGAATTRIDVELFDEGLKSATYGTAQRQMLNDAVGAGYVASVVLDNGTTGNEMKEYMNLGVSEFTNCRHASIGLNW